MALYVTRALWELLVPSITFPLASQEQAGNGGQRRGSTATAGAGMWLVGRGYLRYLAA